MHGRVRVKTTQEQEEERKREEKKRALHIQSLIKEVMASRETIQQGNDLDKVLQVTADLLILVPDFYTAWNIRREAIEKMIDKESRYKDELIFTMDCLKRNEKSYYIWHHRIWALTCTKSQLEFDAELKLCETLLDKDERNFHCWDYRRLISELVGVHMEREMEFCTKKIMKNFSNFSAWHLRHKLFSKGLELLKVSQSESQNQSQKEFESNESLAPDSLKVSSAPKLCPDTCNLYLCWHKEYDMVTNVLFIDPSDQSPWLYHNWLIRNHLGNLGPKQLENLTTLVQLEPNNRWVNLSLCLMYSLLNAPLKDYTKHYDKLIELDPIRANYYRDIQSRHECSDQ